MRRTEKAMSAEVSIEGFTKESGLVLATEDAYNTESPS